MKKPLIRKILYVLLLSFSAVTVIIAAFLFYITNFTPEAVSLDTDKLISVSGGFSVLDDCGISLSESVPIKTVGKAVLDELPPHVKNAFIAVEDKRFYSHGGVDFVRILGAIKSNLKAGRFKEGASTITQQLIKNVYLSGQKNLSRKINEIRLAMELEKRLEKDEILEIYLNTIYFGNNSYGIESAAQGYFDRSAKELTIAQAATLAGLIKAPTNYSPANDLSRCIKRRNTVLSLMKAQSLISQEEYTLAINEDIDLSIINRNKSYYKRYMHGAIQEACEILGITEKQLGESKLKIYTYYNKDIQEKLTNTLENSEILTESGNQAQLCGIVADNKTHGIQGFAGYSRYNLYTMKRDIGSVAKPLVVYAPALEEKLITTATVMNDIRRSYGSYSPRNYNDVYKGYVTVREAVAYSLNSPAVALLDQLSPRIAMEYMKNNGFDVSEKDYNLSAALGCLYGGTGLIELTEGYTTLANGGLHSELTFISRIEDEKGNIIYKHKPHTNRVFNESTAFLMKDMLTSVVDYGTAKGLKDNSLDFSIAAKTGTVGQAGSTLNSDAFTVSLNSRHTVTVWCGGYDDDPLHSSITGGTSPVLFTKELYLKLYSNDKPQDFMKPESVVRLAIDKDALLKDHTVTAIENQSQREILYEYFSKDNQPVAEKKTVLPEIQSFDVQITNGKPLIKITIHEGITAEIHRICDKKDIIVFTAEKGGTSHFTDENTEQGKKYLYYAVPVKEGRCGDISQKVTVTIPKEKKKDSDKWKNWWEWL